MNQPRAITLNNGTAAYTYQMSQNMQNQQIQIKRLGSQSVKYIQKRNTKHNLSLQCQLAGTTCCQYIAHIIITFIAVHIQIKQGNFRYQTSPTVCNRTAHFADDTNRTGVSKAMNASFVISCFR